MRPEVSALVSAGMVRNIAKIRGKEYTGLIESFSHEALIRVEGLRSLVIYGSVGGDS